MPSERQEAPAPTTWLSASHRSTPLASTPAEAPVPRSGGKMAGRKTLRQAKQTNLFSFYGKEPAETAAEAAGKGKGRASSARVSSSGKGKGRELSPSSSDETGDEHLTRQPARKKTRVSEPLPSSTVTSSTRRTTSPGGASRSRPAHVITAQHPSLPSIRGSRVTSTESPAKLASIDASREMDRSTRAASPPLAAIKREQLETLRGLEDDDVYSSSWETAGVHQHAVSERIQRTTSSEKDEQPQRRGIKAEPASLDQTRPASIGEACPPSQEPDDQEEEDPNDQVASTLAVGQPSYHRPTSLLSESLAPYLPASFPSPQRLPQHVVDDLLTIGRPFGGPNGREKYLRRPRMPWETDEAWAKRQAELCEWEADERSRKERAARPLEPPVRQLQVDDSPEKRTLAEAHATEGEASEPDTYFVGGPKKLRWPKPLIAPPRLSLAVDVLMGARPPPLSAPSDFSRSGAAPSRAVLSPTRSSPLRASSTSPIKKASMFHGEESYTLPATHPYSRPFIPIAPGVLGAASSVISVQRSQKSRASSHTFPDSYRVSRQPLSSPDALRSLYQSSIFGDGWQVSAEQKSHPQPPKAAPRRLTEEEETSVILEIDRSRPSPSPERSHLPSLDVFDAISKHGDVVPSSQTEEASSLFARSSAAARQGPPATRTPDPTSPSRILVFASQSQASLRSGCTNPASPGRLALTPSRSSPSRLGSVIPATPFQQGDLVKTDFSPSRSLLLTTPTHGRTSDSEDEIVPTSVAAERPENDLLLMWQRAQAVATAGKSGSPTPTRKGAKAAGPHPFTSAEKLTADPLKAKWRSKSRTSWPVWTGVGLVDADAPTSADDGYSGLDGFGDHVSKCSLPALGKSLAQDSLLQHGFGRTVTRVALPPSPEAEVPPEEAITDEEDEARAPVYDNSIVPSSQSLAPLGWGIRRNGDVPLGGKKVGPVPSPPPRAVLARPSRYKPPRSPVKVAFQDLTRISAAKDRSSTPSPRKAEAINDVKLVDPSQPNRSSDPSTSEDDEDEVDADVTLLAPPPFDLSMLSQGIVPDSQPQPDERPSSPEMMPPSSRAFALLQAESTNYEWLRSSSGSSNDGGLDPGLATLV